MFSAGLREFRSLLHVRLGLLAVAQAIVDLAAQLVQGGIPGKALDQSVQVCQGVLELAKAEPDLRTAVADWSPRLGVGVEHLAEIVDCLLEPAELECRLTFHEAGIGVVRGTRQVPLQGRPRHLRIVRLAVCFSQRKKGIVVVGVEMQAPLQVGNRLARLRHAKPEPAAVEEGVGIVGMVAELRLERGQLGRAAGRGLEGLADDADRGD